MVSKKTITLIAFLLITSCFVLIFIKKSITGKTIAEQNELEDSISIGETEEGKLKLEKVDLNKEEKTKNEDGKGFGLANPTSKWANFYGRLTINRKSAQPGDKIAAFDPEGVLSGVFVVKNRGYYGFLHVYADDPLTSIDEGAVHGDKITFKVFDLSRKKEIIINITATWDAYENIRIDLKA